MRVKHVLQALASFLRGRREDIVKERQFLVEVYDETYGLQDPRTETVEVVDFDALLTQIDEFARTFIEPN